MAQKRRGGRDVTEKCLWRESSSCTRRHAQPCSKRGRLGTQSVCSRLGIELGRIRHPTRKGSVIGQDRRCSTKGQAVLQKLFVGSGLELVRDVMHFPVKTIF